MNSSADAPNASESRPTLPSRTGFGGPSVRLAGGLLYGGTAGLLLMAWYYSRVWAPQSQIGEIEQLTLLLRHIMAGLAYGAVFGVVFASRPRSLGAWLGTGLFGVAGVFVSSLLSSMLPDSLGLAGAALALAVFALFPIVGAIAGARFIR
jgi:hypothetical protein